MTWISNIITPVHIQISTARKELWEEDCIAAVKFYIFIQIGSGIRQRPLFLAMENPLRSHYQEELMEAGCDEAGRGCYAGPVFAAAVILPQGFFHPLLNDSKQVTPENRDELRVVIEANDT